MNEQNLPENTKKEVKETAVPVVSNDPQEVNNDSPPKLKEDTGSKGKTNSKDAEFEKICSKSRCLLPVRWAACSALLFFRGLYKYSLLLPVLSKSGINSAKSADEFKKNNNEYFVSKYIFVLLYQRSLFHN